MAASAKKPAAKKAANKGALIKATVHELPVAVLNEPKFKSVLRKITRGYSGLYLLYQRDRLYYVGVATENPTRGMSFTPRTSTGASGPTLRSIASSACDI